MFLNVLKSSAAVCALSLTLAAPAAAQSVAGPYLAARSAAMSSDFEQAASYFTQALARDRSNVELMESALVAQLALGRINRAVPVATALIATDTRSQVARMVLTADAIKKGDYAALLARDIESEGIGPLVDGLVQAWAHMGAGDVSAALAGFDAISEDSGLRGFSMYHKAIALALVGDYEGADVIFGSDEAGAMVATRRGVIAHAQVLSQLERNDEALQLITAMFAGGTDPELEVIIATLAAGEQVPFSHISSVQEGMSEVFFTIAAALRNEAGPEYTLLYAQVARDLRPDHVDALLLVAELFETVDQYDAAIAVYKQVPSNDPAYHAAELGRAAALRRSERPEAAIEVLEQLTRSHGEMAIVYSSLGDARRQQEDYAGAVKAYDKALALTDEGARAEWFLYYARGISHERLGDWAASEADFRTALEQNPDQPQVLNYLGYSLVEQNIKLDEALEMIERAVSKSPDSGYIIDSLGWALYRLGRYEEAVPHMERAVELMAVDPVVNDHLGDVYWAVGRLREAEFQWHRALSFIKPDDTDNEADPARLRRKLEVGLDVVLSEEGAAALTVAKE